MTHVFSLALISCSKSVLPSNSAPLTSKIFRMSKRWKMNLKNKYIPPNTKTPIGERT